MRRQIFLLLALLVGASLVALLTPQAISVPVYPLR